MTASVVDLLREALGDRIDTTETTLEAFRADKSGHAADGRALAVVHAESIEDVQVALRIAHATGTPVVPRGAGTGLAGGANVGTGRIALSLARMNRILEIRADDLLAVVEPGIINAELNAELAGHGVWWAPDPASRAISTVGGNIATGAGGLLCAKYGVVRDAVLGLEVVLADGELVRLGHRSVKGVTGLDLTSLMIGSEGTLGVVVGATLKLRRLVAGQTRTLTASFSDVRAAAAGAAAVTASGVQPAIMELMDAASLAAVHALLSLPATSGSESLLTVQTDGPAAADDAAQIAQVLERAGGRVRLAADDAEGEALLQMRRSLHPAM
jgi:glycolate oxidase